jgi:hypothetical protein
VPPFDYADLLAVEEVCGDDAEEKAMAGMRRSGGYSGKGFDAWEI